MASGYQSPDTSGVAIAKPDTHKRSYSYIELENGIKAIIGSDPNCDKAGAALCVNVGMVHERKDLPGLAHFLEHMLFTGTTKYPDEGEYHKFIQQNGGTANAYTLCFFTNYMFEIKPDKLTDALDRFSRFFWEPALTRDCTDREINAVDSEFKGGSTRPWWRYVGIMNMSANPDHPFHVACGNLKVLRDDPKEKGLDLYDEMVKLYESCYSANGMTLCVIGKESTEELEAIIKEKFGPTVNKKVTMPIGDSVSPEPTFLPRDWNRLLLQNPVEDIKELSFAWVIPWQGMQWRTKPTSYIGHLLGYEGSGSVISALKQKGSISGCSSGNGRWLEGSFSLCTVEFDLTDEGLDRVEEIGTYLFHFIGLLQKTPVEKWIFEEMKNLRNIQFKFMSDQQPFSLVSDMAASLQTHPASEVLAGKVLLYEYDAESISALLSLLTLDSVRVSIQAKTLADQCTDKDTSYESPMAFLPIKPEWLQAWKAALNPGDGSADAAVKAAAGLGLHLPKPNPFIPENLDLRPLPEDNPQLPVKLTGDLPAPISVIYHRQDDKFLQPKAYYYYAIYSPFLTKDVESFTKSDIWCQCLQEALNEYAYDAQVAGLSYSVSISSGYMSLVFAGFNDKLTVLMDAVLNKIWEMDEVPESIFGIVKDSYSDNIKNKAFKSQPYAQCMLRFNELSRKGYDFPPYQIDGILKSVTRESLKDIAKSIFNECHVEAMILGNASAEDALQSGAALARGLSVKGFGKALAKLPERAEAALPSGQTVWKLASTNEADPNNAVFLRIEVPDSIENLVHLNLLNKVLSSKFFEVLRTQQQLGYIVAMQAAPTTNFAYLMCIIQTEFPDDYVRSRIDAFLDEHFKFIEEKLEEDEFNTCKEGLISEYKVKPKSLGEEFGEYARVFSNRTYAFDRKQRALAFCETAATIDSLRTFLKDVLLPANRICHQVKKVLEKPDKDLPEGATTPEIGADIRLWTSHLDVVQEFHASANWQPVGK